jgi:nucleotide-binding universal stress UspA family protein
MELVILNIGLQEGVITPAVFAMMVIMALVTTSLTTPILHWLFPQHIPKGAVAGAEHTGFTLLVPVAHPDSGPDLARLAAALIGSDVEHSRVLALNLRRPSEHEAYRSGLDELVETPLTPLTPLMAEATKHKLVVEPISFVTRDVSADISAVAKARKADLVLMGFHKPVFSKTILGGTVHGVLNECESDVAILVDRGFEDTRRILIPFMGSSHDRLAMQLGHRIARTLKAEVTVLHIVHPDRAKLGVKEIVDRVFDDPETHSQVTLRVVEEHWPVEAVLRESMHHNLIVVGMAEELGLESRLIGLRPERIARESPGSLLIVRKSPIALLNASKAQAPSALGV